MGASRPASGFFKKPRKAWGSKEKEKKKAGKY